MLTIPPILAFLIILSLLIFVHEIGHFLTARKFGIKIEEFGFGYPPRIWGKKIKGIIYSINWLPFGGFVRIYGEDYLEKDSKLGDKALCNKPGYIRALVAAAGVFGNFILGFVCFSLVYSFMGIPTPTDKVLISAVSPNSPAETAGLKIDQQILSVNNQEIKSTKDFMELTRNKKGQEISIKVKDKNEVKEVHLTPRQSFPEGEGPIGVAISSVEMKFYPVWQMPFRGAWVGLQEAIGWGAMIVSGLYMAIKSLISGVVPEVAGPVGIYQITTGVVSQGWLLTLQFIGVLSINLGILNLLPFPALDGGRLLFIGFEAVLGRRVKPQIEQYVHMAGMIILITLMLLVTYNDLVRLAGSNNFFSEIISSIMKKLN